MWLDLDETRSSHKSEVHSGVCADVDLVLDTDAAGIEHLVECIAGR